MLPDRILIVDDDSSWQDLLRETVEGAGTFQVLVAGSLAAADAILNRQHFHLAFVDLRLREEGRELEGKLVARKLHIQDEGTSVVIATGHADVSTAITALKEWQVLDFILKDDWDPDKVSHLVSVGVAAGRQRYRALYESAAETLRGSEPLFQWMARVLDAIAPCTDALHPERKLSEFLNRLLTDLHPLLPQRDHPGVELNADTGMVCGLYWSKALGSPIGICFGNETRPAEENCGHLDPFGFAKLIRAVEEDALGIHGAVFVAQPPPFDAFVCPQER